MRKFKTALALVFSLFACVALVACSEKDDKVTIASIEIKTNATKTQFTVGEDFSSTGLVVQKKMSDDTNVDLLSTEITIDSSAYNKNASGTYKIVIKLTADTTKTTNYNVTVSASKTTLTIPNTMNLLQGLVDGMTENNAYPYAVKFNMTVEGLDVECEINRTATNVFSIKMTASNDASVGLMINDKNMYISYKIPGEDETKMIIKDYTASFQSFILTTTLETYISSFFPYAERYQIDLPTGMEILMGTADYNQLILDYAQTIANGEKAEFDADTYISNFLENLSYSVPSEINLATDFNITLATVKNKTANFAALVALQVTYITENFDQVLIELGMDLAAMAIYTLFDLAYEHLGVNLSFISVYGMLYDILAGEFTIPNSAILQVVGQLDPILVQTILFTAQGALAMFGLDLERDFGFSIENVTDGSFNFNEFMAALEEKSPFIANAVMEMVYTQLASIVSIELVVDNGRTVNIKSELLELNISISLSTTGLLKSIVIGEGEEAIEISFDFAPATVTVPTNTDDYASVSIGDIIFGLFAAMPNSAEKELSPNNNIE